MTEQVLTPLTQDQEFLAGMYLAGRIGPLGDFCWTTFVRLCNAFAPFGFIAHFVS